MTTQLQETHSFSTSAIVGLLMAFFLVLGCDQGGVPFSDVDREAPSQRTPSERTATQPTVQPFTATQVVKSVIPGTQRVTGSVLHIRGQNASGVFSGDIDGTFTSEWDMDLVERPNQDLLRSGPARAMFVLSVRSLLGMKNQGTFEGRASGFVEMGAQGPVNNGRFHAKGTGDFEGMHMRGRYTQTNGAPPTFTVEGMVLTR